MAFFCVSNVLVARDAPLFRTLHPPFGFGSTCWLGFGSGSTCWLGFGSGITCWLVFDISCSPSKILKADLFSRPVIAAVSYNHSGGSSSLQSRPLCIAHLPV